MTDTEHQIAVVRAAWSTFLPPPPEDLKYLTWMCGEDAHRTFLGVSPVDVDISSPGFLRCTPLQDLPASAAAAYLGTYILSLLDGLEFQEDMVVFYDIITRAHLISCLEDPDFWDQVIRRHLPDECRKALTGFCDYLITRSEMLSLTPEQTKQILMLAHT